MLYSNTPFASTPFASTPFALFQAKEILRTEMASRLQPGQEIRQAAHVLPAGARALRTSAGSHPKPAKLLQRLTYGKHRKALIGNQKCHLMFWV